MWQPFWFFYHTFVLINPVSNCKPTTNSIDLYKHSKWGECICLFSSHICSSPGHQKKRFDVNGASSQECNLVSGKRGKNICLIFCHDLIKQCLKAGFFRVPLLKIKARKSQHSGNDIQNKLTHSSQGDL